MIAKIISELTTIKKTSEITSKKCYAGPEELTSNDPKK